MNDPSREQHRMPSESEAQQVINRAYADILHRQPDSSGMRTYIQALVYEGKTEGWLRNALANSTERRDLVHCRIKRITEWAIGLACLAGMATALRILIRHFPSLLRQTSKWATIGFISLAFGEGTLRLCNHFRPLYALYDSTYNRFKGRPFADDWDFRLNSRGYKDQEFSAVKTNHWRVVGIGDSFAFGVVPYRYNYHTRLEELLSVRGLNVEVCNMGIPSTGPKDYLDILAREGLALRPDLVMVSVFVGNDFIDANHARNKRRWYEYSFLATLMHYLVAIKPEYQGQVVHGAGAYNDDSPTFSDEAFLGIERSHLYLVQRGNPKLAALIPNTVDYLVRMQQLCVTRRIGFLVVIIPDELQINGDLQGLVAAQPDSSAHWDWRQPNALLAASLDQRNIDYIDLLEPFVIASKNECFYRLRDTHWNIAGNELAARIIAPRMALRLNGRNEPPGNMAEPSPGHVR